MCERSQIYIYLASGMRMTTKVRMKISMRMIANMTKSMRIKNMRMPERRRTEGKFMYVSKCMVNLVTVR